MAVTLAEIAALAGVSAARWIGHLTTEDASIPRLRHACAALRQSEATARTVRDACWHRAKKPDQDRRDRPVGRDHVHAHGI